MSYPSKRNGTTRAGVVATFVAFALAGLLGRASWMGEDPIGQDERSRSLASRECESCAELRALLHDFSEIPDSVLEKRRSRRASLELAEATLLRKGGLRIALFFRDAAGAKRRASASEIRAAVEFLGGTVERDGPAIALDAMAEALGPAHDEALLVLIPEISRLRDHRVITPEQAQRLEAVIDFSRDVAETGQN